MNTNDKIKNEQNKENEHNAITYQRSDLTEENKKKKIIKWILFLIFIVVILIALLIIFYCLFFKKKKVTEEPPIKTTKIETEFSFKNEVDCYKRLYVSQGYNETMLVDGKEIKLFLERRTYYDIYVLFETKVEEEYKNYYDTMYTMAITIGKECITSTERNCEPISLVDSLIEANITDLEALKEADLEDLSIPFCLFNITDNDVITSIKCPKSMSQSKIKGIVLDLYFFRPPAIKRPDKDKNNVTIDKQDLSDNKKFIRETNGGFCDIDNPFISFCTTEMNTTTDSEGNLLKYDEVAYTIIKTDEMNSYEKNKLTNLIDITDKIKSFNKENFKKKLDILISKIDPFMQYNELFTMEQFAELYDVSKGKDIESRRLKDDDNEENNYLQKKTLFEYPDTAGANLKFVFTQNSGLNSETMKGNSDIFFDSEQKDNIHKEQSTQLTEMLKKLIILSKSGNHLATQLYNNLKNYYGNITEEIKLQFLSLNNLVVYKELTEIFDSTLSLQSIHILPNNIAQEINSAHEKLEGILAKLKNGSIKNNIKILNKNINDFIRESHQLIRDIFTNLKDLVYSLKSDKSRFTEIATYYLGRSTSLYLNTIENAENILNNYYINEREKIVPKVESMLKNFEDSFNKALKKVKNNLNILYSKFENQTFAIENIEEKDIEIIITNTLDLINNLETIMEKIKEYVGIEMDLKDNNFFISNNDINSNNISYSQVITEAKNIAKKLDNDEYIDLVFDEVMTSFRNVFIDIIEMMDNLKEEQFPLKDNVLESSLFSKEAKEKMETIFENQPYEIINYVIDQCDYISEFNKLINGFITDNKEELNSIVDELNNLFKNDTLKKLANDYDSAFNTSLEKIDKEIDENEKLAKEYFSDMISIIQNDEYIRAQLQNYQLDEEHYPLYLRYWSRTHYVYRDGFVDTIAQKKLTQGYITKYNTFKANFETSEEYIKDQLFLDILSEYKNCIFKLRQSLQTIKDNSKYFKKYPDYDFDFMNNHYEKINIIYNRLNDFLSDEIYNKKYIDLMKKYKTNEINKLNKIEKDIENNDTIIRNITKVVSDHSNDFCVNFYRKQTYTCTNGAISYLDYTDNYCCPSFGSSNNYNKLIGLQIYDDVNIIKFNDSFNDYFKKINETVNKYTSKIDILKQQILDKEEELVKKQINFTNFQKEIDSILSEKYGNELIKEAYKFYNNSIHTKLGKTIDKISSEWSKNFDNLTSEIKDKAIFFKDSMIELSLMASIYETLISQNMTRDYFNSIIEHQRNEFNYTISFYYDYLFRFINTTYQYILNQVPIGQQGLTLITETRKKEINDYFNNLINNITELKNSNMNIQIQLKILQVNESDFFNINSALTKNIEETSNILNYKIDEMLNYANWKETDKFSLSLRYYLENNINGQMIKKIYKLINEGKFINLKLDEFKDLIFNNWIFNPDEFKNNLNESITNSNLEIKNEFSLIKKKFKSDLKDNFPEILKDENSKAFISDLYKTQIIPIEGDIKKLLLGNITIILDRIIQNLHNESENFYSQTDSYNNNYTKINNTIKEYKETVYNKIYKVISEIIDDFHANMINKIYLNYFNRHYEDYINQYNNYKNQTNNFYEDKKLLNYSLNFGKAMDTIILQDIIKEYNDSIKNEADSLHDKKLNNIIDWKEIKELIYDKIDKEYNNNLFDKLKKYATFSSEVSGYREYDLNNKTKNDIELAINITMKNISNTAYLIKGDNFMLDKKNKILEEWDFYDLTNDILPKFFHDFDIFYKSEKENEDKKINNLLMNSFKNDFYNLLSNIIPSFGNSFFSRIYNYNENFRIKNLYNNLRYSLAHTLLYYISIKEITSVTELPTDLKNKLFHINNLDLIVEKKNEEILNILNNTIDEFIKDSQIEIINYYITRFDNDTILNLYFDNNILYFIEANLYSVRNELENIYSQFANKYLKEQFISSYTKTMNEKSKEMIKYVNSQKEILRIKIYDLLTINPDKVLNEINEKMNITENSIEKYINHFNNSFIISNDLINYLNNYASLNIEPLFEKIINTLDSATKYEVLNNLEKNSKIYEDSFNLKEFYKASNNTYSNFNNNFIKNMNQFVEDYGIDNYEENLVSLINKYERRGRRTEEEILDSYKENIADKALDNTLRKLKQASNSTLIFINSLKEFEDFDTMISDNITNLETEYKNVENILLNNKYDEDLYLYLHDKLGNLKNNTYYYYLNLNESYYNVKNYLINSIYELDKLINKCSNITYKTFENRYESILSEIEIFHKNYTISKDEENRPISYQKAGQNQGSINYTVDIINLNKTTEFSVEYKYEGTDVKKPILIAKIVNLCGPKTMHIKIITGTTDCGTTETDIAADFGNSNITMVIYFDTESTNVNVKTYTNFEKYTYDKILYELISTTNSTSSASTGGNSINLDRFKNKNKCENMNKAIIYQNSTTIKKTEAFDNDNITLIENNMLLKK